MIYIKRLLLLCSFLLGSLLSIADTIPVKNIDELNEANKKAKPGDTILLQNGTWKNVSIQLTCNGTKELPIVFKAITAGKVLITGHSQVKFSGNYIVLEGLYFTDGYGGDDVISFKLDKNKVAGNCRVTNCTINDFNNPKRMDENYWVSFSGKNNRVDHCSFIDKKNMGVLIGVLLDDDRSRENFHSIDHNYFGRRLPLASNSGEIIRIGIAQHAEFNSNTQITDNFFEYCDGETEIISVKSCSNIVRGNLFKECQGGVVLRHGNFNTVENNIFLGNNKEGTGGVRIINKGQWVFNNFFYECRGVSFRSPLSIMNGIPNSPLFRYVQVTDAVVANNTFYNCSPASLCEGSDTERVLPPANTKFVNNIFYNTTDSIIYKAFDNISSICFEGNEVSKSIHQSVPGGFEKVTFTLKKINGALFPVSKNISFVTDSLQQIAQLRTGHSLPAKPGFSNEKQLSALNLNADKNTGAIWFKKSEIKQVIKLKLVNCKTAAEIYKQLETKDPVIIKLTGNMYSLTKAFVISKQVEFIGNEKQLLIFKTTGIPAVFVIAGNGNLILENCGIDGKNITAEHFIASDSAGSSNHYSVAVNNCTLKNLDRENGCKALFYAYKSTIADSVVFYNNYFENNSTDGILMKDEKEKGVYNAEKIIICNNTFISHSGTLLNITRPGNDESTMGPLIYFSANKINSCNSTADMPLLNLFGVQQSFIEKNFFSECNTNKLLLVYEDLVRSVHFFRNNTVIRSGKISTNNYTQLSGNTVK